MNNAAIVYRSIRDSVCELDNPKQQLRTLMAVLDYALDGIEPDMSELTRAERIILINAMPLMDRANKRRADGARGGRKKRVPASPQTLPPECNAPLYVPQDTLNQLKMQQLIDTLREP